VIGMGRVRGKEEEQTYGVPWLSASWVVVSCAALCNATRYCRAD
jgi:hypothetical protein